MKAQSLPFHQGPLRPDAWEMLAARISDLKAAPIMRCEPGGSPESRSGESAVRASRRFSQLIVAKRDEEAHEYNENTH